MDSQIPNLQTVTELSGKLLHEVYVDEVKPHLDHISPVAGLFRKLGDGGYTMVGQKLVIAADTHFSGGGVATDGHLPDSEYAEMIRLETTPARMYIRRAVDDFVVARGQTPGAFENFFGRIQRQAVDAFDRMTTRHVHGGSDGTVCIVAEKISSTKIRVKDGYGHPGTNPLMFIDLNTLCYALDKSDSFKPLAAARVKSINHPEKILEFHTSIEGSGTIAEGDVIVFGTRPLANYAALTSKHVHERGRAPLGLRDILDPDEKNASYLTVSEADEPRINPLRMDSEDWGEVEFMDFIGQIEDRSQSPVTPDTHVFSCQRAVFNALARTLIPYTQIQQKGRELEGGWETVRIAGHDFLIDSYHTPDELMAHCLEDYHVVDLDGEPSVYDKDGSPYQRLADFDGREWFMKHYCQRFASRRNRSGVLRKINTGYSPDKFAAVP